MDPEPLLSSLKDRLDLLNELVIWSAAAAVSSGAAAYFGDKKIEIGPVSIPFKAAFYTLSIVFTLLLITIVAASYRSLTVFHLIPPASMGRAVTATVTGAQMFIPFHFTGVSTAAFISDNLGLFAMVVAWWIELASLSLVAQREGYLLVNIGLLLFLAAGLACLASFSAFLWFLAGRLEELTNLPSAIATLGPAKAFLQSKLAAITVGAVVGFALCVGILQSRSIQLDKDSRERRKRNFSKLERLPRTAAPFSQRGRIPLQMGAAAATVIGTSELLAPALITSVVIAASSALAAFLTSSRVVPYIGFGLLVLVWGFVLFYAITLNQHLQAEIQNRQAGKGREAGKLKTPV